MKKTALITGASSGIGKELARMHAKAGGYLVLVARRSDLLEELKEELVNSYGVDVWILVKDLTDRNAAMEIYRFVKDKNITIDYLINNAGFGGRGKFHEREWAKDESMIDLNIKALTALTRIFLPDMVQRNQGRILNVASTAAFVPGPLQAVYYASKAYVVSFSNAIAEELHDTGVTVTVLCPGPTQTEFARVADMTTTGLFKKAFPARKVAESGYSAMLRGKLSVMEGVTLSQRISLVLAKFSPKKLVLSQIRKMQEV
ncbi:MAG: SDR family oxidoreductase [Bacteroidales bacterium]|nr:SDR family oxidoreductase [Bacteroidales bacterium]